MAIFLPLLACLALHPAAQEEPREPKARTTVLHLEGGAVLRTKAREKDGAWEVLAGGEWTLLPAGLVLRAKSERELLEQASALERGLPKDDLVRRVAYADWLVNEGLFVEAPKKLEVSFSRVDVEGESLNFRFSGGAYDIQAIGAAPRGGHGGCGAPGLRQSQSKIRLIGHFIECPAYTLCILERIGTGDRQMERRPIIRGREFHVP